MRSARVSVGRGGVGVEAGVGTCQRRRDGGRLARMNPWMIVAVCGLVVLAVSCAPAFGPATLRVENSPERAKVVERFGGVSRPAVLFVGNSYSIPVPRVFRRQCKARGKDVRVGLAAHGGWSLAQHAAHEPTLRAIRKGGWDIVVLQEWSRLAALPKRRRAEMLPPLLELAREVRAAGALPVIYQTWARRDGDLEAAAQFPDDDFEAMHGRLREGIREAAREAGGLLVVPVGDAWAREQAAGRGAALFQEDGSHPTARGVALAARVFTETFLGGSAAGRGN